MLIFLLHTRKTFSYEKKGWCQRAKIIDMITETKAYHNKVLFLEIKLYSINPTVIAKNITDKVPA